MTPTMSGKSAKIEALPFCRFLDGAADLEPIARREPVADRLQRRPDLVRHIRRLHAVDHVGAHGDRHVAVAPPQDRLLVREFDAADLRQRHGDAVAARRS